MCRNATSGIRLSGTVSSNEPSRNSKLEGRSLFVTAPLEYLKESLGQIKHEIAKGNHRSI
jgi:hypothetical protein